MDRIIAAACGIIVVSIVAILILAPAGAGSGAAIAAAGKGSSSLDQQSPAAPGTGTTQMFKLGYANGRYDPSEIRVKQGTKVRIEADPSTLTGCMTTVNIDGYGISKYIASGDNVIEFTADKTGTFPIHCNMGMGGGTLVVEDSSGSVPAGSSPTPAAAAQGTMKCGCMG